MAATAASSAAAPLTTTFTRPAGCEGIYKPEPNRLFMIDDQPACLPPGFAVDQNIFFSPGIACPSGYRTACMDTSGEDSQTTVTCCPVYGPGTTLSCHQSPETVGERWESLFCTWRATRSGAVLTWTESGLGTDTTTLKSPGGVNAYGIRMLFESTDLDAVPGSTTTSTESGSKESDSAGPTPSEQDSTSTEPTNTDPASAGASGGDDGNDSNNDSASTSTNGGLSQGSTIAIAVVIPVLAVLAALGFFLWWRSRRALGARGQEVSQEPMSIHPDSHTPPGQPGYYSDSYAKPMPPTYGRAELSSEYPAGAELSAIHSPHEMPLTGKQRHEMW